MMPKPFTIYKMKEACSRALAMGYVARCVRECGNRFRYFNDSSTYVNMECVRCGYKYHTQIDTFDERYDKDKGSLSIKDPNLLFSRGKQL